MAIGGYVMKKKIVSWAFSSIRAILLIALSYIVLYPLLYMISSALTPMSQATDPSVIWVPRSITLENFKFALSALNYLESLGVTLTVELVSGIIEVFTCAVIAYGFARFKFPGQSILFAMVVLTIIVPPQAIIIPLYLNFSNVNPLGLISGMNSIFGSDFRINLLNTGWTFYIPSLFGTGLRSGLFIFIYRQFFLGLPNELEEAARIDGSGAIRTFLTIVLPSSGASILCVSIFSIIWHWNDYYLSAMYLSDKFPLSVNLSMISDNVFTTGSGTTFTGTKNIVMAGCLLFILPPLIFYMILQRKFIQSIDRVGIVG